MILRRLATHFAVLGTLLMGTMACVPTAQLEIAYTGFNPRLRPDRQPLDVDQLALESRLDGLRYGPYRTGANELANPLTPGSPNAAHLPQSDCWWMGQGGGDSLRASWEATIEVIGDETVLDDYHDPEDNKLDLGLCRFNDPETRAPVQAVADESGIFPDVDCSRLGNGSAITAGGDNNLYRCTADLAWLEPSLQALSTSSTDALLRCARLIAGFGGSPRRIARGTDFYDGLSGGTAELPSVEACAARRRLTPPSATRYQLEQTGGTVRSFDPVAIPTPGASLGRQMQSPSVGVWAWATTRSSDPTGGSGVRWEENFSPSLQVSKVRFFDLDASGNRLYLYPAAMPPLCIEDPHAQVGCRWSCTAGTAPDGRLQYDLLASNACTVAGGFAEIPRVTPTYAKTTAEAIALNQPLHWSATFAHPVAPYIELQLITVFEPAALRAEPALTDLGGARVGQYARASFTVDNVGAHPMRITAVAMDPAHGGNAPSNFVLQLPSLPVPEPLPIEIVDHGTKSETLGFGKGAESQTTMTIFTDFAHVRVSRRGGGFTSRIGNHSVRDDRGILLRDVVNPIVFYDPLATPVSRTSYALRTPPFTIQPGDGFEISVRGRPSATGDRFGFARIDAVSALDPAQRVTIWGTLKVVGMQGPLISAAPGRLTIVVSGSGIARDRAVLIQNAGDTTGTIGAPTLTAIGGGPIAADTQLSLDDPYGGGGSLVAGDSRVIHVNYLSDCSRTVGGYRDEDAELRWTTPDGPVAVRIDTSADCVP